MHRRHFLAAIGTGYTAGTSGCLGGRSSRSGEGGMSERDAETATDGPNESRLAERGDPSNICALSIRYDSGIHAIVEPSFDDDWTDADVDSRYAEGGRLADETTVIGVEDDETSRAYPLNVLGIHEIVNDMIGGSTVNASTEAADGGRPIIVTYCPLCRSGLVAGRSIDNAPTEFLVSGLLWEAPTSEGNERESKGVFGAEPTGGATRPVIQSSNLVMYDEATGSYWSQVLAKAICGPLRGADLAIVPSSVTTWGEWRDEHPNGNVLLPPPASTTSRPYRTG